MVLALLGAFTLIISVMFTVLDVMILAGWTRILIGRIHELMNDDSEG